MSRYQVVRVLFVEADASIWTRAEQFFAHQLGLVGAGLDMHVRASLPARVAGFGLVSLNGLGLIPALLERQDLREDLRRTAIVNLHANAPDGTYGHLRHLLHRKEQGLGADGLWVFPASWMAPWFREPLEFPELGLRVTPQPLPPPSLAQGRTIRIQPLRASELLPNPSRLSRHLGGGDLHLEPKPLREAAGGF
jgi:hypothetical protein